jgi:V8-like Glu-specific endopeptidase
MTTMRNLRVPCVMAWAIVGCGSSPQEFGTQEERSICGTTDWQDVESYDGTLGTTIGFVNSHQASVANIRWRSDLASRYTQPGNVGGVRWCTATLVARDLLITAGHCFDPDGTGWTWPRSNSTGVAVTAAQGAAEMVVDFNYQNDPSGVSRSITTVSVTQLVEYRLGSLDYAVIRVSGNPGDQWGITIPGAFPTSVGDAITIIQHPDGIPKVVHAGTITSVIGSDIYYATADTDGGSSGSGVLNNASGLITGIHTNAGCNASGGSNRGVRFLDIYDASSVLRAPSLDAAKLVVTTI